MSNSTKETLHATLRTTLDQGGTFNLGQLNILFGTSQRAYSKYVERRREPLWEGLFGMFEGPVVVPVKRTTQTLNAPGISASNEKYSKWLGLTMPHHASKLEAQGLRGKNLTALCAYLGKRAPYVSPPTISRRYEGPLPSPDTYKARHNGSIHAPFGVGEASVRFRLESADDTTDPLDSLLFIGNVSVSTHTNVANLPESLEMQANVLDQLTQEDNSAALYGLYGFTSPASLQTAWDEAMLERTPMLAAESIQASLA